MRPPKMEESTWVLQDGRNVLVNLEKVDGEIKKILSDSYERAKNILRLHAKEHKALAEALLKRYKAVFVLLWPAVYSGTTYPPLYAPYATTLQHSPYLPPAAASPRNSVENRTSMSASPLVAPKTPKGVRPHTPGSSGAAGSQTMWAVLGRTAENPPVAAAV